MSNQTPLPPLTADDIAGVAHRYAYGAAETTGTDFIAELHRFLAWVTLMQTEGSKPLEQMVQELENENARLMQELALAESRLAGAWDEGHEDGQHNEHEYRPGRQITNPYRIGGDVQ